MISLTEYINESLLLESYHNYLDKKIPIDKAEQVVDILNKSYEPIGGWGGSTVEDLLDDPSLWMIKTWERNGKVIVAYVLKSKDGGKSRKTMAVGTDGSEEGKRILKKMFAENVKMSNRWWYAEVSKAIEHMYLKYGGASPVPNVYVEQILGKKILSLDPDGFHYTRNIHGTEHRKLLIMTSDEKERQKLIDYLLKKDEKNALKGEYKP